MPLFSEAQKNKLLHSKIAGTWTIKTHVGSNDGKESSFQDKSRFYVFDQDGTFVVKYFGESSPFGASGKWKVSKDSSSVELYNIKMNYAAPPNSTTSNHQLKFISFNDSTFQVEEMLYDDVRPGLSTYKKIN